MNVSTIRSLAEIFCGVSIEDDIAIGLVNEGLAMIGDLAYNYEDVEFKSTDRAWIELGSDVTNVVTVTKADGTPYSGWTTRGMSIRFDEDGTYLVTVKKMPQDVEQVSDEPDCHPMFHRALVTYLRGMVKLIRNDQSAIGAQLLQQFEQEVARVSAVLERSRQR
jgi:hypothetical protein